MLTHFTNSFSNESKLIFHTVLIIFYYIWCYAPFELFMYQTLGRNKSLFVKLC